MQSKYLRAISDAGERKVTATAMKAKTACGAVCVLALVASFVEGIAFGILSGRGKTVPYDVLYVTIAAAMIFAVFYFFIRAKINARLKDVLTRPAGEGECEQLVLYRAKMSEEFACEREASGRNVKIVAPGAAITFVFMAADSLLHPESEGPGTLSLVGACVFIAACAVAGIMWLRCKAALKAKADPETAELAKKIDEASGIPAAYSRSEDKGARDLSYLFPDPEIRARAEKAKRDLSSTMAINGVVTSAMSLCMTVVFCSGKVFENNFYGYAFPMFLSVAFVLLSLSLIQPYLKFAKIEKEQLALLKDDPRYADNLELYRRHKEYSSHKGRTMIYAMIACIVTGFALAIPFPHAAWSAFSALILVAGIFLNNKFYAGFRQSVMPLEKKIDMQNAEREGAPEANDGDDEGEDEGENDGEIDLP